MYIWAEGYCLPGSIPYCFIYEDRWNCKECAPGFYNGEDGECEWKSDVCKKG